MLDILRKELLNLTLSNNLLKLREFKAKGIIICDRTAEDILQNLVEDSQKCTFLPKGEKGIINRNSFSCSTSYNEKELEKRLTNTYKEAKSFIEERGINALFLSLGALKWYEDDNSEQEILSPLLLVPVQIERNAIGGETTFEMKYSDESLEPNYTLERKMEVDYGVKFPVFDDTINITEYFQSISETVKNKKRWEILPNEIRINLFSFLKLMMYHDLDDSRWSDKCVPSNNSLIKNLLNNHGNLLPEKESDAVNEKFEFDSLPISEIDHILDADSSQAEAIERVFKNKYLVIKGPPGTGKSQTIANIIASCIRKDKTVLFVSEKLAALEVVKNRLEKTGLGAACLELHSYKANRRDILENIRQTLELKTQQNVRDNGELLRLEQTRQQLNDYYYSLLLPIGKSEFTPYHVIGEILKIKNAYSDISLLGIKKKDWSRSEIRQMEDSVKAACDFVIQNGQPRNSPFFGVGRLQIGLREIENLKSQTIELQNLLNQLALSSENLAHKIEIECPKTLNDVYQLAKTANLLLDNPGLSGVNQQINEALISSKDLQTLFEVGNEFHKLQTDYDEKLLPNAHDQNFYNAKFIYETKGKKWYRSIYSDFRQAKKQIISVSKTKPNSIEEQLEYATAIVRKSDAINKARVLQSIGKEVFTEGVNWEFDNNDKWLKRQLGVEYIYNVTVQRNSNKVHKSITEKLNIHKDNFSQETQILDLAIAKFDNNFKDWMSNLEFESQDQTQFWNNNVLLFDMEQRVSKMIDKFDLLTIYCQWNSLKKRLEQLDCQSASEELLNVSYSTTEKVYTSWWFSIMTELLDEAFLTRPALNQLQLSNQAAIFKETDKYLIESYNRLKIKYLHLEKIPSKEAVGVPMGILRNEINKQRRHLPLRKLLEQTGEMIVRIKPIFMMSPLSVAQFLKPEKIKFDYIIFDEASQVKPIEAFGALLRGDNVVVVGDDKQLPPSDFFNQVVELEDTEDENETSVVADMESILDLFVTKNAKQTMLQWHYRSKHESLIAVSNEYLYDSKLINLPSASRTNQDLGLQFKHLPDTIYSAQKNEKEAEYIINALKEHAKLYPNPDSQSVGIVAFSIRQKDCIENLLMKVRKEDTSFDKYMNAAENAQEPFFVKNLENVQGDERDVIFVSICYGRTLEGKLNKNFGPVNRTGGERRLNVLFTRARLKCVLFSNFTAGDLPLSDADAKGLKVFKAFLDYAQNRRLSITELTNKPTDSPFEDSVKAALEREGYEVHTQIGSAGYFVDLAIPNTEQKGWYLLGIECDGATYHSSRAARERDRIRQTVLEGLGWQIYRIWSTDWFRQPTYELKKLLDHIAILKNGIGTVTHNIPSVSAPILESKADKSKTWQEDYQQAKVDLSSISYEIHLADDTKLINVISNFLEVEAPVHQDYLKTVITQQLGISRIGDRIFYKFQVVFDLGVSQKKWQKRGNFIWLANQKAEKARDRSKLYPEKLRQIEWVSPKEIQFAIKNIVLEARSIDKTELMKETLKILNGGVRLTEGIKFVIENELNQLVSNRILKGDNEIISINS